MIRNITAAIINFFLPDAVINTPLIDHIHIHYYLNTKCSVIQ